MIYAEIKGKIPEVRDKEDLLTSNVIGLLSLLPDFIFVRILNQSIDSDGKSLNLEESQNVKLHFWKKFDYGEPDIFIEGKTFVGIIEAKFKSAKSGSAYENEETKEIENKEIDQLGKYWKGIENYNGEKFLIYLTNDPCFPFESIKISEKVSGEKARIFWLNWTSIHYELVNLQNDERLNDTDRKIIKLLESYCKYKGFKHFMGWEALDYPKADLSFYRENYWGNLIAVNINNFRFYNKEHKDG